MGNQFLTNDFQCLNAHEIVDFRLLFKDLTLHKNVKYKGYGYNKTKLFRTFNIFMYNQFPIEKNHVINHMILSQEKSYD